MAASCRAAEGLTEADDMAMSEARLAQRVPELLEAMNRATEELNLSEMQHSQAQCRHRHLVTQCDQLYTKLRPEHSPSDWDSSSRLLDAEKAAHLASKRARAAFRAVSSCHEADDGLQAVCAIALVQQQEAHESLSSARAACSSHALECTVLCLRQLKKHRADLCREQDRIAALALHMKASKKLYAMSLAELEEISMAIHALRQAHQTHEDDSMIVTQCLSAELVTRCLSAELVTRCLSVELRGEYLEASPSLSMVS